MPTLSTANLPPPRSDDEFDDIVADALRLKFERPQLVRFGRRGQRQHGIDGLDPTVPMGGSIVWQATLQQESVVSKIGDDLRTFDAKFDDQPELFVAAFGIAKDAVVQVQIQRLSDARLQEKKCPVLVLFWSDVRDQVCKDEQLARKYFSAFFAAPQAPLSGNVENVSVRDDGRSREQVFRVANHGSEPFTVIGGSATYGFNDAFFEEARRMGLNPEWRGRKWDQPATLPDRTLVVPGQSSDPLAVQIYRSDIWREFHTDAAVVVGDNVDKTGWYAYLECTIEGVVRSADGRTETLSKRFPWRL